MENNFNWKKLQNGSDIRGVALDGITGENVNLTPQVAKTLACAFTAWLVKHVADKNISVAIGTDSRLSGDMLKTALIDGFIESGVTVFDCGLASTPAMFMTTIDASTHVTAGIMITASHLPFNRNGFKFFTKNGGLDKKAIAEILEIAASGKFEKSEHPGIVREWRFIDEYANQLVKYIRDEADLSDFDLPLKGLKIIVDAGNGAGGFFASKVLAKLGADTSGSQFLEPDGTFPNHIPNPENEVAMASICEAVIRNNADLGIIFDTDVDRSAIVNKRGEPVNRNSLIALISAIVLREHPGSTIVTDSITSEGLTFFIEIKLKGVHHRFKRGYKNVIDESVRLNGEGIESWLAIETSGHAALKENYFLDDGAFLIAKLLVEAAKLNEKGLGLSSLIDELRQPVEDREIRFNIRKEDFVGFGNFVLERLKEKVSSITDWEIVEPNYEGIRVRCKGNDEKGWFLLRLSLHDPVMPLNIESDLKGGVDKIENRLMAILEEFGDALSR